MKKVISTLLICMLSCCGFPQTVYGNTDYLYKDFIDAVLDAPIYDETIIEDYENNAFLSGIMPIDVGDNEFFEMEPNDDFEYADRICNDYTVYGAISNQDLLDIYTFDVTVLSEVQIAAVSNRVNFVIGISNDVKEIITITRDTSYENGYFGEGLRVTLEPGQYYILAADTDSAAATYAFYLNIAPMHLHDYDSYVITEPTCIDYGYTTYYCDCGDYFDSDYLEPTGVHRYQDSLDTTCDECGYVREVHTEKLQTTAMYRLYNPNSGEHFYTGSTEERDLLESIGWNYEGIAWNAPIKSGASVYRLFNPNSGDHHYTMSIEERNMLVGYGWQYEGVAWNSASSSNIPIYRLYNPNADCGSHHYTSSTEERDFLVNLGWIYEGIGWYGMLK